MRLGIKLVVILLIITSVISCKEKAPPFPTKKIYSMSIRRNFCDEYTIVKEDPLTVDEGREIPIEECPLVIFGFSEDDTGAVFQWIRDVQEMIKNKTQNVEIHSRQ